MSICARFLSAARAVARKAKEPTDRGWAILDNGFGFTAESPDGHQIELGRSHCKYCARAELIGKLSGWSVGPSGRAEPTEERA